MIQVNGLVWPLGSVTNSMLADMAQTTAKGRALAGGTGAPVDLTAAQVAAIVGSVGGALKTKIISSTRNLTTASGNVAYTGAGFQPTCCFVTAGIGTAGTTYATPFGMADNTITSASNAYGASAGLIWSANFMFFSDAAGTSFQTATIVSYDADGLTLAWTKTGTPTGTVSFAILAAR